MSEDRKTQHLAKQQAVHTLMPQLLPTMLVAVLHRLPFFAVGLGLQALMENPIIADNEVSMELFLCIWAGMMALQWLLSVPLDFGLYRYLILLTKQQKAPVTTIFDAFNSGKDMARSVALAVSIGLHTILWYAVPSVIYIGLAQMAGDMPYAFEFLTGLYFVAISVAYCKVRTYATAYIVANEQPTLSAWQAVKQGAGRFRGKLKQVVLFELGFVLWYFLGMLSCGIILLFVMIYEALAFVFYYNSLQPQSTQEWANSDPADGL